MTLDVKTMLAEANAVIDTVAVHDAVNYLEDPDVVFIDVRDDSERRKEGRIPGTVHAPRGFLEFFADPQSPMHNPVFVSGKRLILFCATGGRSTLATKTLVDMGVPNVAHFAGGFSAWRAAGGAISEP